MTTLAIRLTCFMILFATISVAQPVCIPAELQCEYLKNPLGVDAAHPRLMWKLEDSRKGAAQTAYQLIVGTDSLAVSKGNGDQWKTAQVNSSSQLVIYQGKPLQPFT